MIEAPCKNCKERVVACHSKCNKYLEYKTKMAEVSKKRKAHKASEYFTKIY